jgi:hypothetical protein
LKRVHENADGNFAFFPGGISRDPDQFAVTAMERAHRWHEHSALGILACLGDGLRNA